MDTVSVSAGLDIQGRIGLVLGVLDSRISVYAFAQVPPVSRNLGEDLLEIINYPIQKGFSMKLWVIEHAVQVNKLLIPNTQILGLFTTSPQQIIDKKNLDPISSEIYNLLKKINKTVKSNYLIHLHVDTSTLKKVARVINFKQNTSSIAGVYEDTLPKLLDIRFKVPLWIELKDYSESSFDQVVEQWTLMVNSFEVRFEATNLKKVLGRPVVQVYSKDVNRPVQACGVRVKGVIESKVIVPEGSDFDQAVAGVKKDLVDTLVNRHSIINKTPNSNFQLPRRVFAHGLIPVCDYLTEKETYEDSKTRLESLFNTQFTDFSSTELLYRTPPTAPKPSSKRLILLILVPILLGVIFQIIIQIL
jgi:Odorant response abnormal 4-like